MIRHRNGNLRFAGEEFHNSAPYPRPRIEIVNNDETSRFHTGVEILQSSHSGRIEVYIQVDKAITSMAFRFGDAFGEKTRVQMDAAALWSDVTQYGFGARIRKTILRWPSPRRSRLPLHVSRIEALERVVQMQGPFGCVVVDQLGRQALVHTQFRYVPRHASLDNVPQ